MLNRFFLSFLFYFYISFSLFHRKGLESDVEIPSRLPKKPRRNFGPNCEIRQPALTSFSKKRPSSPKRSSTISGPRKGFSSHMMSVSVHMMRLNKCEWSLESRAISSRVISRKPKRRSVNSKKTWPRRRRSLGLLAVALSPGCHHLIFLRKKCRPRLQVLMTTTTIMMTRKTPPRTTLEMPFSKLRRRTSISIFP